MRIPLDFVVVLTSFFVMALSWCQMSAAFDRLMDHLKHYHPDEWDRLGRPPRIFNVSYEGFTGYTRRQALSRLIRTPSAWASDDPIVQRRILTLRTAYHRFWAVFVIGTVIIFATCAIAGV